MGRKGGRQAGRQLRMEEKGRKGRVGGGEGKDGWEGVLLILTRSWEFVGHLTHLCVLSEGKGRGGKNNGRKMERRKE